jgi:hypothetical protein
MLDFFPRPATALVIHLVGSGGAATRKIALARKWESGVKAETELLGWVASNLWVIVINEHGYAQTCSKIYGHAALIWHEIFC